MNKDYEDLRNKARGFGLNLDAVLQEAQEQIVKAIMPEIQSRIDSSVKANVPTIQEIVELLAARIPVPKVNMEDVVNQVVAIAQLDYFQFLGKLLRSDFNFS